MKKKERTQVRFKLDENLNKETQCTALSISFITLCSEFTRITYLRKSCKPYKLETLTRNLNMTILSFS